MTTHRGGSGPHCIIVGGGVIGSSIACFLANHAGFNGRITVIEADPAYRRASTTLSAGGVRHQFSNPHNVLVSRFCTEFVLDPGKFVATEFNAGDLAFVQNGYLMLATAAGVDTLGDNVVLQRTLGADIELLDPGQLADRFPWIRTEGIAAGAHGRSGEGWIDPYALLMLFRKSAIALGAEFSADRVTGIIRQADRIISLSTARGRVHDGDVFINAAGPAAASICEIADCTPPPVRPRKRMVFVFHCRRTIAPCPLVVDPTGVYFRPEGDRFICGLSPPPERDPDAHDYEIDHDWFHEMIWPRLARRVKAFEAIKLTNAWAGHYAFNTFDQNALIGLHPETRNFYLANGFSGHGLQQSPAVGRAVAELIADGGFKSLDLEVFSPRRILENRPVVENNVV